MWMITHFTASPTKVQRKPIIMPGITPANAPPLTLKYTAAAAAAIAPIIKLFIIKYPRGLSRRQIFMFNRTSG
jgi:hypothetical protein